MLIERLLVEIVSSYKLSSIPILTNTLSAKRMYYPQSYHHIQEIQKYNIQDYRPRYVWIWSLYIDHSSNYINHRMEQFQKAIRKVRQVQRMRKQRGYAFSQADESQTRVLQAYDTTKERGRYGEMQSSKRNHWWSFTGVPKIRFEMMRMCIKWWTLVWSRSDEYDRHPS